MLKNISSLGKSLSKEEQKVVSGGNMAIDDGGFDCYCNGTYKGKATSIQECWDMC
ncbi:hypothetical protein [uncultured Dokdonia sp.]|uniref:hypothetical protein n=1 Tax=uncultured Dokdonia sp. TaxID=575653 RepID=UPI002619490F|nr:hypothetical protein [uncultured Dokdonia sp.]